MAKESRLSQFQRNETATTTSVVAASYEGPLPHPQILRQYDDLLPGLANRIVKMVEEEGIHRRGIEKIEQQHAHDMDKRYLNSIVGTERWGQIFGFLIGIAGLASASYVAVQGQPWAGSLIGGGTIVSLVYVFVVGKKMKQDSSAGDQKTDN